MKRLLLAVIIFGSFRIAGAYRELQHDIRQTQSYQPPAIEGPCAFRDWQGICYTGSVTLCIEDTDGQVSSTTEMEFKEKPPIREEQF